MGNLEVGQRIRNARQKSGLSQRRLAKLSGISPNTLSLLERGQTSPTVATLQKLAGSLAVDISVFFTPAKPEDNIIFSKADRQIPLPISEGELCNLSLGFPSSIIRPLKLKIKPGAKSRKFVSHSGIEFVYCLDGELLYVIADRAYLLEKGDSLLFNAKLRHKWQNSSNEYGEILMIFIKTDENEEVECDLIKTSLESQEGKH